jgi:hypothetical protein
MDPTRFSDPDTFSPARYLRDTRSSADAALSGDPAERDHFAFGAGRRICPGMHVADCTLFIGIARLLWAYNILPPVEIGTDGKERPVMPDRFDLTPFIVMAPRPFGARFVPRLGRDSVVRMEWEQCMELLDESGQWREMPSGIMLKEYVPEEEEDLQL